MAIGYVNKTSTVNSSGSSTSTVVATPAGISVGHRLVAVVGCIGTGNNVVDPTGSTWVKLGEYAPETNFKTAVYYRNVTGTEAASYTWGWTVGGRNFGYIVAYSGCDLDKAPAATPAAGTPDDDGPHASATVTVEDQGWLVTAVAARQSPGVNGPVTWTSSDGLDAKRHDQTATNTGGGAQLTATLYDSNRALAGTGSGGGVSGLPDGARPLNKYNQLFTGSGAMKVGATMKIDELSQWQNRIAGIDWMRVFPNSNNLPPDWNDPRIEFCRNFNADPFLSTKVDGDNAKIATLLDYLEAMPSWIKDNPERKLWITDRHEPEGDVTAAAYKANITEYITKIDTLPAPIRSKIMVGPVLTRQWTENTAGRTYLTHDPGIGEFFGVDAYANSWTWPYPDPATFLSKIKAYRYNSSDTRPRILPELGAIGHPNDPDGSLRAAWMQGIQDQLVTWGPSTVAWQGQFLGWCWWNAEGKSGDSIAGIGKKRWFHFDRIHNGEPYGSDPEGGFDYLPVVVGSGTTGSGGTTSSASRSFTASSPVNRVHVWAITLAATGGVTVGGNPWRHVGLPFR